MPIHHILTEIQTATHSPKYRMYNEKGNRLFNGIWPIRDRKLCIPRQQFEKQPFQPFQKHLFSSNFRIRVRNLNT